MHSVAVFIINQNYRCSAKHSNYATVSKDHDKKKLKLHADSPKVPLQCLINFVEVSERIFKKKN